MTFFTFKHCVQLAPVLAAFVIVLGASQPASAATCNQDLAGCYQQAAGISGLWDRMSYALDCDSAYVQCALQGFDF